MLSFALLFAIVSISSAFTLPQADPSTGIDDLSLLINGADCSFYTALNTLLQCGPKSHLMQYSYKYCQRLLTIRDTFADTQYQDAVRECLQKKLFDQVKNMAQASSTCDGLKKLDLDSHGSCLAVSFKQLSADDIQKFLAVFKDTTVNYPELCKLANSFAGHWSQIVQGDLMVFVKNQLRQIFPEGDTSSCSIKEKEIIEEIEEIIDDAAAIFEKVKSIKDNITSIIKDAKAIADDYKSIEEIIEGMKNGSISEFDGTKQILQKSKSMVDNANKIIDTIRQMFNAKPSPSGDAVVKDIDRVFDDLISIVGQIQALQGEVTKIIGNVDTILDLAKQIEEKKIDLLTGLEAMMTQAEAGYKDIGSMVSSLTSIEGSAVDIFDTIFKGLEGSVNELVDQGKEQVEGIIDGATGGLGGLTGGFGGIGK